MSEQNTDEAVGVELERTEVGFHGVLPYRVTDWREGYARFELDMAERLSNRGGNMHGGVILTMVDIAALSSGTWTPEGRRPAVTVNINTNFVAALREGTLVAEGFRSGGGRTTYFGEAKLSELGTGRVIASGTGVFKIIKRK